MSDTAARLQALDDQYTAAVNEAIAGDREDLIRQLVREYPEDAAEIVRDAA